VFLSAGILLLLANMDVISLRPVLSQWWPLILVVIGVKHLIQNGPGDWLSAVFWIGTGALFLSASLGFINVAFTSLLWPVLLIWFGVAMAIGSRGREPSGGQS
jgi:hypothetical protein